MAGEERRSEQVVSTLDNLMEQGFSVVRGLRDESESAKSKVTAAQELSVQIANHHKSRVLEAAADNIQEILAHVEGERKNFPPDGH